MNMAALIAYWRARPFSFIEKYFHLRLYWYQKLYLRMIYNRRLNGLYDILLQRKYAAR